MAKRRAQEQSSSILAIPRKGVLIYGFGALCLHFWLNQVCEIVPAPYLDEAFHIPQAQTYWAGLWQSWDPKITTPPGLYVYSYILAKVCAVFGDSELSVRQLRMSVEVLLMVMPALLLGCHPRCHKYKQWSPTLFAQIMHANLNIMLCPLLFFFSALYYTDVLSAFAVMVVYRWYVYYSDNEQGQGSYGLSRLPTDTRSTICKTTIFFLGLFALLVRQTNVFWVAIFLGGLQAVKTLSSRTAVASSVGDRKASAPVKRKIIHDPLVRDAAIEDYVLTVFSLISAAPRHLFQLIGDLLPYLAVLVAFASFVIWNGGVVLGDKENHVASIHLPQMLYIWPCIVFFSWPVLLPNIARISQKRLPRLGVILALMGLMGLAVHFNTIVHPFTLADNRHYVFYVFRILLRHPMIRYAAVPVYFACSWLVIDAMGDAPAKEDPQVRHQIKQDQDVDKISPIVDPPEDPTPVSFVLVWLAATSMSLVTAPLVEPRYFIVPWLVWRMNLPIDSQQENNHDVSKGRQKGFAYRAYSWFISNRLWIETAWYLCVNFVTCYVFLYKGFFWPQEPGKVQRFMW